MKCPYCGSKEGYYMMEKVHRALLFSFDGEPDGATEKYYRLGEQEALLSQL